MVLHLRVWISLDYFYSLKSAVFETMGDELSSEEHEVYVYLFAEKLVYVNCLLADVVGEEEGLVN